MIILLFCSIVLLKKNPFPAEKGSSICIPLILLAYFLPLYSPFYSLELLTSTVTTNPTTPTTPAPTF